MGFNIQTYVEPIKVVLSNIKNNNESGLGCMSTVDIQRGILRTTNRKVVRRDQVFQTLTHMEQLKLVTHMGKTNDGVWLRSLT